MNAIHNARVQLLATLLNTMAGSSFTVGVAAPIAASIFYGTTALPIGLIAVGVSIWLTIALMLHILGQIVLRGLKA